MLNSVISDSLTLSSFLLCTGSSIVLGVLVALVFTYKSRHTASFAITLALLPAAVQLVIMMVNGNLGTGIAVAGAFALVRFRSIPGTAKEIAGIFIAMALGLSTGMGYIATGFTFFVIIGLLTLLLTKVNFCGEKEIKKVLKITIPENLDYEGIFDDLFEKHTEGAELYRIKTTNMGTLYELTYHVRFREGNSSKKFIDELRCRNGNLNIIFGRMSQSEDLL